MGKEGRFTIELSLHTSDGVELAAVRGCFIVFVTQPAFLIATAVLWCRFAMDKEGGDSGASSAQALYFRRGISSWSGVADAVNWIDSVRYWQTCTRCWMLPQQHLLSPAWRCTGSEKVGSAATFMN